MQMTRVPHSVPKGLQSPSSYFNLGSAVALTHTLVGFPACADRSPDLLGGWEKRCSRRVLEGGTPPRCPQPLGPQQHPWWPVAVQSGFCLPSGTSAGPCPEVPSPGAVAAALWTHTAMFRSGDSLSLAALVRKHFLCSLLVFCALWMLRAPLGLVCIAGRTA